MRPPARSSARIVRITRPRDTLLFDLDGTLTDTDALHFKAYQTLLAPLGRTITRDLYKQKIMGAANEAIMAWLFPDEPVARHRDIAEEKERLFRSFAERMLPLAGLTELLAFAEAHRVKTAVVTNAPRVNAEMMLSALGLAARFPVLVIGDELARGKPDPLPYLTALERLDARAERALAFEDSRSGVQAASRAGVETIGMLTGLDDAALRASGASSTIGDFNDPWLRERLAREFAA
ncbi:MAG: HAD-IA family hydrolase [Alphaproteobacteria bacterium]|nr:HAD-IA family hydrolase [Alphaproteobacteria bacterium]